MKKCTDTWTLLYELSLKIPDIKLLKIFNGKVLLDESKTIYREYTTKLNN